jgi:hypothetical protein
MSREDCWISLMLLGLLAPLGYCVVDDVLHREDRVAAVTLTRQARLESAHHVRDPWRRYVHLTSGRDDPSTWAYVAPGSPDQRWSKLAYESLRDAVLAGNTEAQDYVYRQFGACECMRGLHAAVAANPKATQSLSTSWEDGIRPEQSR